MAFVFRGDKVDEETKMRATQRLYLLLPNHKCPSKDCPFHPPEEATKEEEELPTEQLLQQPKTGVAGVEEGGRMLAPPPPPPKEEEEKEEEEVIERDFPAEFTVDPGEDSLLSDHDSVMTGDSGVGRERDDFSDGEVVVLRSVSPEPPSLIHPPPLQHIEEDEEVATLTPESSTLGELTSERSTPVMPTTPPEVEEEHIRDARARHIPELVAFSPLLLPSPEPTTPADYRLQVAPEFTAKLKNKRVPDGLSLHLHCSVTGLPEPHVRWLKEGLEIRPGMGFTIKNNYGSLTLEVARVCRQHGGVYTCEAYNDHGTVSCDATVTTEGEEAMKTIEVEILRPRFLTQLQDLVVREGVDVSLSCVATGKPLPDFRWQKDMMEINNSSRVTVTSDRKGGSTLTIRKVKASDAGLYLVLAKSRSGRCKSTATLRVQGGPHNSPSQSARQSSTRYCFSASIQPPAKVHSPPSFSLLLPPTLDVHEGNSMRLDCSVQGNPTPIVSWYKNHRGLMYGPRHRVLFVGSLHTLHIPQTMALDSGDYIVRAINTLGSAESVCTIRLLPPREQSPGDDSAPKPPLAHPSQQIPSGRNQISPASSPSSSVTIIQGEESEEKTEAPYFTKALPSTLEVSEGENFRLDCVLREGIQLVPWTREDDTGQQPLPPDQGDAAGQLPSSSQDHAEHSSQEATEEDASTRAKQRPTEDTGQQPAQSRPPHFQEALPEKVEVGEGESVSLTCVVSQPFARINWFKDGDRLSFDSQRVGSVREEGGRVSLRVDEVQPSDAGLYRCVATLSDGTQLQSESRLSVGGKGEGALQNDTRQATTSPADEMRSSKVADRQLVLVILNKRQTVEEGQSAKFKVSVEGSSGSSPTTVIWSREGQPLEAGPKYKMHEEGVDHCLEIRDVSGDDKGTYVVTASNRAGTVTASASLDILGKPRQPDERNKTTKDTPLTPTTTATTTTTTTKTSTKAVPAPTLRSPLRDMDVVIGDRDVKLQCEVDADVTGEASGCRVRWFHEGKEVGEKEGEVDERGYRRVWKGRVASLVIRQISWQHAGLYRCEISRSDEEGRVTTTTTSCTLSVGEPEKLEPPFFIKELHDLEVEDGDKVELVVEVEGARPMQVLWHHNNAPLTPATPGVSLHAVDRVHSLLIPAARARHGGEYVCEAYNQYGDTDSFCSLHVKEHADLDLDPPVFLTPPPLSITVSEGAPSATFTCRVKGQPRPAVTWTRQGHVLLTGHGYTVSRDGDTHSLHILNPLEEHAGDYVCHVHSTAGTVTERCTLRVSTSAAGVTTGYRHETIAPAFTTTDLTTYSASDSTTTTSTSKTITVNSAITTTTSTTRPSRTVGAKGVTRSPSWHSSSTSSQAFGIGIRVGSVRKRRDWFEQRASPSRDRASSQGPSSRSGALPMDRQRQTSSQDRTVPSDAVDKPTVSTSWSSSLSPGPADGQSASHDVLAPAIYQIKTLPFSVEDAEKIKTQSSVTILRHSLPSRPGVPRVGVEGEERGTDIPHSLESQASTGSVKRDGSDSSGHPQRQEGDRMFAPRSEEAQRQREVQTAAKVHGLRANSPGRVDFRSVLRNRPTSTDSARQQQAGRSTERHKADFRSVLRKKTEDNAVRRLFPDISKTDTAQTSDANDDVRQSMDEANTDRRQQTGNSRQSTEDVARATTTQTKSSSVPRAAETVDKQAESSGQHHVTSAWAAIRLSAPGTDSAPSISSRQESSGRDDVASRKTKGPGQWQAPRVVQGLEDQPQPVITWSHNSKDIKPSRFFQLSYQEPHAQLLVHEAFSEDKGEYTCTATSSAGTDSSSCYLTVEGVSSKHSAGSREECDVSKLSTSTPGLTSSGNESSVVNRDTKEVRGHGTKNASNAGGEWQMTQTQKSGNDVPKCTELHAASAQGQPMSGASPSDVTGREPIRDASVSDVSGHLPAAGDSSSVAAAGDDVMAAHVMGPDQVPQKQSGRDAKVILIPGRKFQDHYECGKEVGRGKFGSVHECRERQTGAVMAAKVLKVVGMGRKEDVRREVEVMNVLRHPTLLLLQDAFEADRSMVLVTEFVGGGELLERVSGEHYVLTERDCVHFLRQLCEGLTYMHAQGVLHLDLKPNNVLCVDPHTTRIKIIDFGLARFYKPGDSLHVLFGTPEFVAPEVISYDEISFATDMWSIGVITYILVSGLSPFLGDDDAETLANVTRGEFDFDDDSFDVISDDAKDFISCLLLKRKEKRLSADQCGRHAWLSRSNDRLRSQRLNTENLRSFVQAHRKRWHKAGQAIIATQRLRKYTSNMTSGASTVTNDTLSGESTLI